MSRDDNLIQAIEARAAGNKAWNEKNRKEAHRYYRFVISSYLSEIRDALSHINTCLLDLKDEKE